MKCIIKIVVVVMLICSSLSADITSIRIEGDRIFSESSLQVDLLSKIADANSEIARKIIYEEISRLAEELGYFQVQCDISVKDTVCIINISKHQRYELAEVNYMFLGDSLNDIDGQAIEQYIGQPASHANIRKLQEAIADYYSENGYPFVQVKLASLEKHPPQYIDLNLEITSGPQSVIDSLVFHGDHGLTKTFLLKKTGLENGRYFSDMAIRQSLANLNSLPYLKPVNDPLESYADNFHSCILEYNLERQNSNQIEGAVGYNPATDNRDGYLFGFLNLTFYNPLGDGKDFRLQWNKPGQSSSRTGITA